MVGSGKGIVQAGKRPASNLRIIALDDQVMRLVLSTRNSQNSNHLQENWRQVSGESSSAVAGGGYFPPLQRQVKKGFRIVDVICLGSTPSQICTGCLVVPQARIVVRSVRLSMQVI